MSDMAPTITRVRDTNEFITAVSVKERIAACLAVFIKRVIPAGGFGRGGTRTPDGGMDYEGKKLAPGMIQSLAPVTKSRWWIRKVPAATQPGS